MSVISNRILRNLIFALGVTSLVLGFIGAILPIMPTTPFILLSSWCFLNSSQKAHAWLHAQPVLGVVLRNWEERRAISRKAKTMAIAMMAASVVMIWLQLTNFWVKAGVSAILLLVSLFIATRPE